MSKLDSSGQFSIGAETFTWVVRHYAGESSTDNDFRGISARVSLRGANCRELVIEFDRRDYPLKRPAVSKSFEARLKEYTQKAVEEGWRPDSRGKPYRIVAERLLNP